MGGIGDKIMMSHYLMHWGGEEYGQGNQPV